MRLPRIERRANSVDEFSIIEAYFTGVGVDHDAVTKGPGDDCAILSIPDGCELCVSTDTLLERVHFLENAPGEVVAARSLTANVSDLAAMGATPVGFLLALTIPHAEDRWLGPFAKELSRGAVEHGISLVGGNMSHGPLSVTITVFGTVPKSGAMMRSGAGVGDAIYVTGSLGQAAAGLDALKQGQSGRLPLKEAYLSPQPQWRFGSRVRELATACIDISDGFIVDLSHLLTASEIGAELTLDDIPLSEALLEVAGEKALQYAMYGGDDYELCFSIPEAHCKALTEIAEQTGTQISRIATVVPENGLWSVIGDQRSPIDVRGYKHF
jgi:thiamine-monophosphate kinase